MQPTNQISYVPTFDGKVSSSLDYEQRAISRNGSMDTPPEKRSTLLLLRMDAAARQVRLFSGGDTRMEGDDVVMVVQTLQNYFQPDAADRVFTLVDKFTPYVRTGRAGGALPTYAFGRRNLMESMAGGVEFTRVSRQLRQLFQAPTAATKEDILRVTEAPASTPDDDLSCGARLAYKKGDKQRTGAKNTPRSSPKSGGDPDRKRGSRRKTASFAALGAGNDVTGAAMNIIFCLNVRIDVTGHGPALCPSLASPLILSFHHAGGNAVGAEIG